MNKIESDNKSNIPCQETRDREVPEYNFEQWLDQMRQKVLEKLKSSERMVINNGGPSASGKGEATEELRRILRLEGRRILTISTDDYYKGIANMIIDKIPSQIGDIEIDKHDLTEYTRNIIRNKDFKDKFSEEDLSKITDYLREKYQNIDPHLIIETIKLEFSNINFDTPEAVNLNCLAETVDRLKKGEKVDIPQYSMNTGEPSGVKSVNGKDYDIIEIEGVYGLNEDLVQNSDIKSFIEADPKTLLMRRFRRDITDNKRTTMPPETVLWMTLEIVSPGYKKYILPDRKNADLVLKNNYTGTETFDTQTYDVQDKIPVDEDEISKLEKQWGDLKDIVVQEDYCFTNEEAKHDPSHIIRARVENGRLKNLIHKGNRIERSDGKIVRPTEEYIKDGQFGNKYHNIQELISGFQKGGFKLVGQLSKVRKIYRYGQIEIMLDNIPNLGNFIELRTNNKLSLASEVDDFKKQFNLSGRKSAGPYIDEYIAKLSSDPEAIKKVEILLNSDVNRELIIKNNLCETLEEATKIIDAFKTLRKGYPNAPLSEQCTGHEFRDSSKVILDKIAEKTLVNIDKSKVVVLMPWRSGLAFSQSYRKSGIRNFYHLSSKRDEETLQTIVDFEDGKVDKEKIVIISDPMLATGNTIIDAIHRMREQGVSEENIIINSVVAAPVGVAKIKKDYPHIRIITGSLDEKLDHKGYIVPGLGDFGDKYFANMSNEELNDLIESFDLDEIGKKRMLDRIKKQNVSEILQSLLERDFKDIEIDKENRDSLKKGGLELRQPGKTIRIDTSRVVGVDKVAKIIIGEIDENCKIISIEGMSGTGKSSTTEALREKLSAIRFSMGEIFRYLTYRQIREGKIAFDQVVSNLTYKIEGDKISLFDGEKNISKELAKELRSSELEQKIPSVSSQTQGMVIKLVGREIERLSRQSDKKILLEGRGFTLDFLPSDLRVKLTSEPVIRAERRWAQNYKH